MCAVKLCSFMILDFGYFTPFSFYYTEVSELVLEVRKAGKVGTRGSAHSIIFCYL